MTDPKIARLDTDNEYQRLTDTALYRLPDDRIVTVDDTAAKGASVITFTLEGGEIVNAYRVPEMPHVNTGRASSVTMPDTMPKAMNPEAARIILELVQQVIATLLYFARAAHDQNAQAPAQVPFASLPKAWQADFTNVALMAVNGLEAEKRHSAEIAALAHAERWMKAHMGHHYHEFVIEMTSPTGPNIVTEILAAYQEALCRK